jgi:hypothetical protein
VSSARGAPLLVNYRDTDIKYSVDSSHGQLGVNPELVPTSWKADVVAQFF